MKTQKIRIDKLLVKKGLCESREKAQALILAGKVWISADSKNFQRIEKPGTSVPENVEIKIEEKIPYVSRGGIKLEGALKAFDLNVKNLICLDIGASTGGFTHCLLLNGAKKVYAVDVGKGQLHYSLRIDPRVIVMEKVNARYLTPDMFPEKFDLITIDVSFISLKKILPVLTHLLKPKGQILALIKPQFEVGPKFVKKGVVKDSKLHKKVVNEIWEFAENLGLKALGVVESPILGPKGNREFFILLQIFCYY
ncbi:TlyA family RNA methyltransferase [Thermodesulfobacterium hydrogeniphilum]|uniref:TlyA family RNA methyltransferase n=1 Tax=Thermodesulfobacterium hydrogeniphilum TaxID=161156 RepID=UPI00056F29DC|nr:TlyA family RNA methyltransferase [Thermodesulfobacterium hydrogeniphilum]